MEGRTYLKIVIIGAGHQARRMDGYRDLGDLRNLAYRYCCGCWNRNGQIITISPAEGVNRCKKTVHHHDFDLLVDCVSLNSKNNPHSDTVASLLCVFSIADTAFKQISNSSDDKEQTWSFISQSVLISILLISICMHIFIFSSFFFFFSIVLNDFLKNHLF